MIHVSKCRKHKGQQKTFSKFCTKSSEVEIGSAIVCSVEQKQARRERMRSACHWPKGRQITAQWVTKGTKVSSCKNRQRPSSAASHLTIHTAGRTAKPVALCIRKCWFGEGTHFWVNAAAESIFPEKGNCFLKNGGKWKLRHETTADFWDRHVLFLSETAHVSVTLEAFVQSFTQLSCLSQALQAPCKICLISVVDYG